MKKHLNVILLICNMAAFITLLITALHPIIESDLSENIIDSINGIILNLCCGVHVSTFFYYLLVYFPEKHKRDNIRALISPLLKVIANNMQIIVAYFVHANEIKKEKDYYLGIPPDKFHTVKTLKSSTVTKFSYRLGKMNPIEVWKGKSEFDYFVTRSQYIQNNIEYILSLPSVIFEDEELVSVLAKINDSLFMKSIHLFQQFQNIPDTVGTDYGPTEFYTLYSDLLAFIQPDILYVSE
nr:hypothetical protein [Parabacteroides goldsteinii]